MTLHRADPRTSEDDGDPREPGWSSDRHYGFHQCVGPGGLRGYQQDECDASRLRRALRVMSAGHRASHARGIAFCAICDAIQADAVMTEINARSDRADPPC